MYAIMGVTGQVGGAVARTLLEVGCTPRAIVRDAKKGEPWAERGCAVAVADAADTASLARAFAGAEGVFVMLPPLFDPSPDYREARGLAAAIRQALLAARPDRVVCLSTIGAQAAEPNLLSQLGLLEASLGDLPMPVAFVRAAWFMENAAWDLVPARESGVVPSFLQPLDRKVPMVATEDVGRTAAGLLREGWTGRRVVELEGPSRVSPNEIAGILSTLLERPVRMEPVPHARWETLFRQQGMQNPAPRIRMLDGFNEGWIAFETDEAGPRKGTVPIEAVLRDLLRRAA